MTTPPDIAQNLRDILARIDAARKAAIAPARETKLIAVTKTHDAADIEPALQAGQRIFGENRVQEAIGKWPALRARYPDIELHLIGPLQTNKVKDAVRHFDAIHSLDRPKLAEALRAEYTAQNKAPKLFIQVNTGEEPQKAGIPPREAVSFARHCRDALKLPVIGLMCIPPVGEEPGLHFALLKKIAGEAGVENLSIGMSGDFETAIRFGATHVRVGSAIFGERI